MQTEHRALLRTNGTTECPLPPPPLSHPLPSMGWVGSKLSLFSCLALFTCCTCAISFLPPDPAHLPHESQKDMQQNHRNNNTNFVINFHASFPTQEGARDCWVLSPSLPLSLSLPSQYPFFVPPLSQSLTPSLASSEERQEPKHDNHNQQRGRQG